MLALASTACALVAALVAALQVASYQGTRVWGSVQALEAASASTSDLTAGTRSGSSYTYGEPASDPSSQYNGRVYDPGTGFHDYGARMYWPEIGRFISADSRQGDPAEPMTLNRYSYVLNNPYKYVDPTGHDELLFYYAGDSNGTFQRAAETYARNLAQSGSTTPVQMIGVTSKSNFQHEWALRAELGVSVDGVAFFGHGGDGNLYFRGIGEDSGTLTGKDIAALPKLNYKADAKIDLHSCNGAEGSSSAAESFARGQGVPTTGRTGFTYFSEKADEYKETSSESRDVYLDAYSRGKNSWFGSGKRMPSKEVKP